MNLLKVIMQAFISVQAFYLFLADIVSDKYLKLKYCLRLYLFIKKRDQTSIIL